ncbi:MAG: hypothetical protein VX910_06795 [Candidatus Latescibacterota bacterium]|nr:hypothetical protein [Candidatus Latescibacterota bacterium]
MITHINFVDLHRTLWLAQAYRYPWPRHICKNMCTARYVFESVLGIPSRTFPYHSVILLYGYLNDHFLPSDPQCWGFGHLGKAVWTIKRYLERPRLMRRIPYGQ